MEYYKLRSDSLLVAYHYVVYCILYIGENEIQSFTLDMFYVLPLTPSLIVVTKHEGTLDLHRDGVS